MALGTTTAILLGSATALTAGALTMSQTRNRQALSQPIPLPQAPSIEAAETKGKALAQKKRAAATQTVFTDPLGVSGQADITRKVLLGQ